LCPRVTMKGLGDEEAVLCTRKATYSIKHVETTNSLFMVPESEQGTGCVSITATAGAHLELTLTAPRFSVLDRLLEVHAIFTCNSNNCCLCTCLHNPP
jgi:sister chromatid cohesion protein DCC1